MACEDTYSPPLSLAFIVLNSLSNISNSGSLDLAGKVSIDFTACRTESHIYFHAIQFWLISWKMYIHHFKPVNGKAGRSNSWRTLLEMHLCISDKVLQKLNTDNSICQVNMKRNYSALSIFKQQRVTRVTKGKITEKQDDWTELDLCLA